MSGEYERLTAPDTLTVAGEEVPVRNFTIGRQTPSMLNAHVATLIIPQALVPERVHDIVYDAMTELMDRLALEWEWEQRNE